MNFTRGLEPKDAMNIGIFGQYKEIIEFFEKTMNMQEWPDGDGPNFRYEIKFNKLYACVFSLIQEDQYFFMEYNEKEDIWEDIQNIENIFEMD